MILTDAATTNDRGPRWAPGMPSYVLDGYESGYKNETGTPILSLMPRSSFVFVARVSEAYPTARRE